jgi:hypothetical protein
VDVIVRVPPAGTVPRLHGKAATHAPAFETNVRPAGVGSAAETDCASDGPPFVTTVVKTTFAPPGTAVAGPVLEIDRSADAAAVPDVVDALFAGFGSGVGDETMATFAIAVPVRTAGSTLTVSVKAAGAGGSNDGIEHVTSPPAPTAGVVHDHPPGDASETNVVPGGKVSFHDVETAEDGPRFVAVTV